MNIGSLIRGLLGEQRAGETKTLDMKPGQVVRGVVMNVSEDGQEAVVQIQGVQVKAKLETPLQAGETALLQVQPPGEEGATVLKPLGQAPNQTLTPSSMVEVLEFAGLPDTKENREMIRGMGMVGIPLTKENIAQFKEMLAVKLPQVPLTEWIESSAIAFHRGLPITAESVKGLHQAVFGPQLHELLQTLEKQISSVLQVRQTHGGQAAGQIAGLSYMAAGMADGDAAQAGTQTPAGGGNPLLAGDAVRGGQQALLTKLQSLLPQLRGGIAPQQGPWAGASAQPAQGAAGAAVPPAAGQAAAPTGPAAGSAPPPMAQAAEPGEGAAGPSPKPPAHGAEPWVGRLLKLLGAEHEQQVLRGAPPPAQQGGAPGPASGQAVAGNSPGNSGAGGTAGPLSGGAAASGAAAAGTEASQGASAAVFVQGTSVSANDRTGASQAVQGGLRVAIETGMTQAAPTVQPTQAVQTAQAAQPVQPAVQPAQTAGASQGNSINNPQPSAAERIDANAGSQPIANAAAAVNGSSQKDMQDTLKGLLLQLAASNDIPPALKEAAGQLIHHLTGQQLLLNTDRTAPFAQVTMFIPLHGEDGQQTASVHIQSRRGRKGELDATNCRLWFDLDMKHLGPTVIDVHVVDRIVSLNLRNDQPWVSELFESRKSDLAAGVESIGYQLLSMKTSPFPEISESGTENPAGGTAAEYTPQIYKGVDYRI